MNKLKPVIKKEKLNEDSYLPHEYAHVKVEARTTMKYKPEVIFNDEDSFEYSKWLLNKNGILNYEGCLHRAEACDLISIVKALINADPSISLKVIMQDDRNEHDKVEIILEKKSLYLVKGVSYEFSE